ncbi:MAG: hypothetical protein PHO81_03890 [Candidatus Omnitrophica bacterium]|nr:hypothetical protein [Candidatus Omnitrophota bacterium]
MAGILDYLVKEYNLKLIMVEVGVGDVSLTSLRNYADKKSRMQVADRYLKAGKISGEEYLDIISDYPLQLYGIEDQSLYDEHIAAFRSIDEFRKKGAGELRSLANAVNKLEPFIYSNELRQLREKEAQYKDKDISLVEYCRFLNNLAQKEGIDRENYPHLTSFCDVARLEKEIDFKKVEFQRDSFIKELAGILDEKSAQDLITMTKGLKSKLITPERYYSFLRYLAEGKIDLRSRYPQLCSYIEYVTTSRDVEAASLVKEMDEAKDEIEAVLLKGADQKQLAEITKSIQVLNKALDMELTPEDYSYFQANKPDLATGTWIGFLRENCAKYNLDIHPVYSDVVDDNLQQLEDFYRIGTEREKAFIKNMARKLNGSKDKTVVLITGGFHTPGISRMLKDKGYSYLISTPVITKESDSSLYFSVLRNEGKEPEEEPVYEGEDQ